MSFLNIFRSVSRSLVLQICIILIGFNPSSKASGAVNAEAGVASLDVLNEYFGAFRTKVYGKTQNVYSNRFFNPTSNIEVSVKLKQESGTMMKTFNFNLEVPLERDDNSIFLKFLFLEFPLDGAEIKQIPNGLVMKYNGKIQEPFGEKHDRWETCTASYDLIMEKMNGSPDLLKVKFVRLSTAPCQSFEHNYELERVRF